VPPWTDEDGDEVTATATLAGLSLPHFVTFEAPEFSFAPLQSDVGAYSIRVTLTDSGDPPRKTKETFQLIVLPREEEKSEENPNISELLELGAVTASLEEITMNGELTIKFSKLVEIESMGTFGTTLEVELMGREGK